MNEFKLFAHGVDFDPDVYLASATLKFEGLWRKGESGHGHPASSGVFQILGDGRVLPISEQEEIAIAYLEANREPLKALAQHPQVTTFILGLQYNCSMEMNTVAFWIAPPAHLMWHCLDVGVSPYYYVVLERSNKWL